MASEPSDAGFFNSPIVHLIRNSLAFFSWKDRKAVMPELRAIYRADAAARLDESEAPWGERYPAIAPTWRRAWEHVVPMFAFPPQIRKMIYTTMIYTTIERLHVEIERRTNVVGILPNEDAITRLVGAVLLEQNDERAISRRYMTLDSLAPVSDNLTVKLPNGAA